MDFASEQNKQEGSFTFLLMAKLSLVRNLFFDRSHKKKCTLGGIFKADTAGVYTGKIPLKLINDSI
jgi:hypothetical protein